MAAWTPPKNWQTRPVAVLGAGVLGRRIAACWAAGGWPIKIRDPSAAQRQQAKDYVKNNIGVYTLITRRKAAACEAFEELAAAVADCWLVIEAVPEILELKLSTYAELEQVSPMDCIFASNSSSYKSRELVERISDSTKARVLNTHYMMPPDMLLVELMTDGYTSEAIFPFLAERHQEAGLHPLMVQRESTGFVMNRVWAAIKRETLGVLSEGVSTPEAFDIAYKELWGAREGPCRMMDLVGLDTVAHIEEHYVKERQLPRSSLDWLEQNFVQQGKLGKKSEEGGLYPKRQPGSQTKLYILNVGMAESLQGVTSMEQVLHKGQVLSFLPGEGGKPTELVGHEYLPDGIDLHDGRLYWTDMGTPAANDGAVYSAKLDGTDVQSIVPPGAVHTPKQCVVDAKAKKLYFCDREGCRVMRVNLDGSDLETLVQTVDWQKQSKEAQDQKNWCVGITISHKLGKLFWTQKGFSKSGQGRIFSANLNMPEGCDATTRTDIEVVQSSLPEPIDLECDDERGALYWTDRGELPLGNTLNKKQIAGQAKVSEQPFGYQILAQGFGEAIGLKSDTVKNCVWVADWTGRLWKCDPDLPGPKEKVFEGHTSAFTGIALQYV